MLDKRLRPAFARPGTNSELRTDVVTSVVPCLSNAVPKTSRGLLGALSTTHPREQLRCTRRQHDERFKQRRSNFASINALLPVPNSFWGRTGNYVQNPRIRRPATVVSSHFHGAHNTIFSVKIDVTRQLVARTGDVDWSRRASA